jgi:hypothetical protein
MDEHWEGIRIAAMAMMYSYFNGKDNGHRYEVSPFYVGVMDLDAHLADCFEHFYSLTFRTHAFVIFRYLLPYCFCYRPHSNAVVRTGNFSLGQHDMWNIMRRRFMLFAAIDAAIEEEEENPLYVVDDEGNVHHVVADE